jgi:Aldehyde dehydrogenase family/Thioredoxin
MTIRILDEPVWESSIFTGRWVRGGGEVPAVVEPATGKRLTTIGMAAVEDVDDAAKSAVAVQGSWAARPYTERASVLRKAGALFEQHADKIAVWIVRESGGTAAKAELEIKTTAEECYSAAALAAHPFGEVLRSERPRLSLSRRVPVGTVGVIAPFNFPLILSVRALYAQQPSETAVEDTANSTVIETARKAGAAGSVPDCVNSGRYTRMVDGLAAAAGIHSVPTIRINGQTYEHSTPDALVAKIEKIAGEVPGLHASPAITHMPPNPGSVGVGCAGATSTVGRRRLRRLIFGRCHQRNPGR